MERCPKCNTGVLLVMKTTKKTILPDAERKQCWKCSRCGYYLEKPQVFRNSPYAAENLYSEKSPSPDTGTDDYFPNLRRR